MNVFSRGWVLALEFLGLGILSVLLIVWVLRQRATRQIEGRTVTVRDILRALQDEIGRIFLRGDPAPTILVLSVLIVCIGLKFVWPSDTLASSGSYAYLNRTAFNEATWGAGLIALGSAKLVLLGYNAIPSGEPYRLSYYLGGSLNAFMALIWFNFALGIGFSNIGSFGWLTYGALTVLSLWAGARRLRQGSGGS